MIFVFLDDSTLDVTDPDDIQGKYDGIDVEAGEYVFFEKDLRRMQPKFEVPNNEGKILGIFEWVDSGTYKLIPGPMSKQGFLKRLAATLELNSNPWFETLEEVRNYAQNHDGL